MLTYLKTIQSNSKTKSCDKTPLRKVRQRFPDLKKPKHVIKSLAEQKQPIQRGRLLLLGNSDAGKTSTMKSLMGEPLNQFEEKTCGVDIRFVDRNWKEIPDSAKACSAPAVEAKLVAEGAMKDRDEMQHERRTTHELYRAVLTKLFEILEPYMGSSACWQALTLYIFLLLLVAVLGLCQTAALDATVFFVLELHREMKVKAVDYRVWLFIMYGICIGIGIGKLVIVIILDLPSIFSNEIMLALALICVAEILMMSKRLAIGIPVCLRSILDIMDIPTDSAKIVHFCIIGIAFKLCFSGRCPPAFYGSIFLTIFVLQFGYLISVGFAKNFFAKLFLLLESIIAVYHFTGVSVGSVIIFFVVDIFIHAVASCHNMRTVLNHEDKPLICFFGELMKPSHPLSKANELLANPDYFQHQIEAIRTMRMQLLDFAGDKGYYCYHHIFLVDNAIYLVVFDCSGELKLVHQQVKSIWFWLESISIQSQQSNCVFLVATHCYGKTRDDLEKINELLNSNFYTTFADKFVFNTDARLLFFPVENLKGPQDIGVCVLREAVIKVANEIFNENIPLPWFKLEDKISELRKSEEVEGLCMAVDKFKALSESCGCEDIETDHVMNYLYNHGLVLYARNNSDMKPSNWILLQPQLLIDVIVKLVEPCSMQEQEAHVRRHWELLRRKGFLTRKLLSHILSPFSNRVEGMRSFLEDFNVISSVEHLHLLPAAVHQPHDKEKITHFIPAMLPEEAVPSYCSEKTFYIFFKRFLPEAAFYALMAHAYKCSTLYCPDNTPEIKQGYGLFWLSLGTGCQMCYELTLMKDDGIIKVTFNIR